jgi:nitroreductase
MKEIFIRRSIRKYNGKPIESEKLQLLLKAAMAAPTAGNSQEWEFVVITDRAILNEIPRFHQYSTMLKEAEAAIVVCANLQREKYADYWIQDCAAATQNILLEATCLGIGSVWLGVYPNMTRVKEMKKLLSLPENVMPLSIVSLGYSDMEFKEVDRYDENKVHYNKY